LEFDLKERRTSARLALDNRSSTTLTASPAFDATEIAQKLKIKKRCCLLATTLKILGQLLSRCLPKLNLIERFTN